MGTTTTDLQRTFWGSQRRPFGSGREGRNGPSVGPRSALVVIAALAVTAVVAVAAALWPSTATHRSSSGAAAVAAKSAHAANGGTSAISGASVSSGALAVPTGAAGASTGAGAGAASRSASSATGGSGAPAAAPPAATALAATKVIENGQVGIQVGKGSVTATVSALTQLGAQEGGFVASSAESSLGGVPTGSVTLRIPNAAFDDALAKVRAMGKVQSSNVTGQDVTAQYQDLADQITALRQSQTQYLSIMARANTVGDVLAVQEQVDQVDSQLQQLVGQQKVLDDQTTYATLTVNVGQPGTPPPRPAAPHGPWANAFLRAGNGFADALQGLIGASGALAFALLVGLAVGLVGLTVWRRFLRPVIPAVGE